MTIATKPAAATGEVLLAGSTIVVHDNSVARVKLTCIGTGTCEGKVTLRGKGPLKKGEQTIGVVSFSIPAGETSIIECKLNAAGRVLLKAIRERLNATLTVLKSSPAPSQEQTDNVQLVQQTATHAKKSTK
jgi:hypothetical protein